MEFSSMIVSSHVLAGIVSFITGIVAMISKKGGKIHLQAGMVYLWAMAWVFISALLILYFVRFNFFLMVIAIFSFYACFSGYRVTKRKLPGQEKWYDWFAALLLMIAGVGLLVFGIYLMKAQNIGFAVISLFFGLFSILSGYGDIKIFREKERAHKMWWFFKHMGSMLGSYIALITAFLVNNMPKWLPSFEHQWIFWVLPTFIIAPLIAKWTRSYKVKFGLRPKKS